MPVTPALLDLRGLRVRHHLPDDDGGYRLGEPAPDGVDLVVHTGETVLLLGPSGCGKSTLALATNGLVPHVVGADVDGTVITAGHDVAGHRTPELAADVAMVFQDPDAQVVTATVLDEVCFAPENLCVPADEVLRRAEAALRQVGLWDRRADDPAVLSGGGRQRLALACALASGARLLVLDEPTANLDPAGVEEVYAVLRRLTTSGERGVLLVEHDLDAAASLADRVVVLDGAGRVATEGAVRDVLVGQADRLAALGVWLPTATLAALRLRDAGIVVDPLPLLPAELTAALDALPALPPPSPPSTARTTCRPTAPATSAADAPGPDADAVVRVRDLTVRRGGRTVLDGIDLDVARGELVALVGANGAGKTTLAQVVAGVLRPRRRDLTGSVRVAGLDPRRAAVRDLTTAVGFVFQNPEHQLVTTRVDDELALGLRRRGLPEDEVAARVEDVLRRFGLTHLRDRHPFWLSGGQKRRLSVGTAVVTRPDVLVLDEPTYGQDRERAVELLDLLTALHDDGTTVVVVSHDMQLVAEHATRVVALADGRVVADGTPDVVLGDDDLLHAAGLRAPALARATRGLRDPAWRGVTRLADLPSAPLVGAGA
ncbi:Putative HMP/thiamine import ATP-binding protein YkoD [Isoptericola dokdonensis DS-3]|uniref:Putative HMP/thiamine import ATP-binding protein YkoD n=1 Tax=Isoptericola dokdonensis DS-3 TaxID=1300344 RepID=A0A161I085_9MICO|nr:ABC transporter ATP-binding protein [Isoptericola dokdonensis]ANC32413.1 Putative HMP/thiamine import ATP-binding protein YkoD [Isoptericola dokdonensis DS-3]